MWESTRTPFVSLETCGKVQRIQYMKEIHNIGIAPVRYLNEVAHSVNWAIPFRIRLVITHDLRCAVQPE